VLTGFIVVLLVIVGLTQLFQLDVISWILGRFFAFLAIAVLVIFHPSYGGPLRKSAAANCSRARSSAAR